MEFVRGLVVACFLLLPSFQKLAAENSIPNTDLDLAMEEAQEKGKMIFLELYADWCPPCVLLEKEILKSPEGQKLLEPFVIVRINVDTLDRWNYQNFNTTNVPTVFLLDAKGQELSRICGYDEKEIFIEFVQGFLAGKKIPKLLEEKIKLQPDNIELREELYSFYLNTQQEKEAAKVRKSTRRLRHAKAQEEYELMRFTQVSSRFNGNPPDYKGTIREANSYLSEFSTNTVYRASVISFKAKSLWALDQHHEAIELMKALPLQLSQDSRASWRLIEFSRVYGVLEEDAQKAIDEGLQKFPKNDYFLMQCGQWLHQKGKDEQALKLFNQASEIAPHNLYYKKLIEEIKH